MLGSAPVSLVETPVPLHVIKTLHGDLDRTQILPGMRHYRHVRAYLITAVCEIFTVGRLACEGLYAEVTPWC